LEGLAGRLAASNVDDALLVELRRVNAQIVDSAEDGKYSLERNYRFHFLIYERARRPTLLATIENFWVRIGPSLHYYPGGYEEADTLAKHNDIIDALARRDPAAAERAVIRDLENGAQLIMPRLPAGKAE
jgi:DNA-binding GntR family transcriptional regulator